MKHQKDIRSEYAANDFMVKVQPAVKMYSKPVKKEPKIYGFINWFSVTIVLCLMAFIVIFKG